jgi:hypothetical protein
VNRVIYLVIAVMVAMVILAPSAMAQGTQPKAPGKLEETIMMEKTAPLPPSGGPAVGAVLLPTTVLLLGAGILGYAVLRQRR